MTWDDDGIPVGSGCTVTWTAVRFTGAAVALVAWTVTTHSPASVALRVAVHTPAGAAAGVAGTRITAPPAVAALGGAKNTVSTVVVVGGSGRLSALRA